VRKYIDKARELRRKQTEAERHLWHGLRSRNLANHKFRRQHVIGNYIVDFVCLDKKLIIELDGSQHLENTMYDNKRTAYLQALGYRVLRFWNNNIFDQLDAILETIMRNLEQHPSPHPSPRQGERA